MFSVQKMNVLCYCCIIWTGWWRRLWHRALKVKYKWVIPVLRRNGRGRDCLVRVEMFPLHWNILPVLSSILTGLGHYLIFNTESFSALAAHVSLTCDETQQPLQSNSLPGSVAQAAKLLLFIRHTESHHATAHTLSDYCWRAEHLTCKRWHYESNLPWHLCI